MSCTNIIFGERPGREFLPSALWLDTVDENGLDRSGGNTGLFKDGHEALVFGEIFCDHYDQGILGFVLFDGIIKHKQARQVASSPGQKGGPYFGMIDGRRGRCSVGAADEACVTVEIVLNGYGDCEETDGEAKEAAQAE